VPRRDSGDQADPAADARLAAIVKRTDFAAPCKQEKTDLSGELRVNHSADR
jgi:hypothetical protein